MVCVVFSVPRNKFTSQTACRCLGMECHLKNKLTIRSNDLETPLYFFVVNVDIMQKACSSIVHTKTSFMHIHELKDSDQLCCCITRRSTAANHVSTVAVCVAVFVVTACGAVLERAWHRMLPVWLRSRWNGRSSVALGGTASAHARSSAKSLLPRKGAL